MDAGLILVGVLVSALVTFLKGKLKTNMTGTLLLVAVISLVGAGAYTYLVHVGYWDIVWKVVLTAGAFYAYIIKNVKDILNTSTDNEITSL